MSDKPPERTEEMVRLGQVWVGMNYPDGSHGWEVKGTGALWDDEESDEVP